MEHLQKPSSSTSSSPPSDANEDLQTLELAPSFRRNVSPRKKLSKQLSMCEVPRALAWERRRRQFLLQERRRNGNAGGEADSLTDEDLNELKACIELGFDFNEENRQRLSSTLPALDLYFAVNRQLSSSPVSSPGSTTSDPDSDAFKIIPATEDPQRLKTRLRHWAQAVACSLKQSSSN